jgi:heme/copper-type cytochrome/quinol oxidase subunit 2
VELKRIEKSGAIISTIGLALLITFIIVLLAFPMIKECQRRQTPSEKCQFHSTAPNSIQFVAKPVFLSFALFVIAIGVGMTRFAVWYQYKKIKKTA